MSGHKSDLPPRLKQVFEELASNIERTKALTYAEIVDPETGRIKGCYADGVNPKLGKILDVFVGDMCAVYTALSGQRTNLAMDVLAKKIIPYFANMSNLRQAEYKAIEGLPPLPLEFFKKLKADIAPFIK